MSRTALRNAAAVTSLAFGPEFGRSLLIVGVSGIGSIETVVI